MTSVKQGQFVEFMHTHETEAEMQYKCDTQVVREVYIYDYLIHVKVAINMAAELLLWRLSNTACMIYNI